MNFQFTNSDANEAGDITQVGAKFARFGSVCNIEYAPTTNTLALLGTDGQNWIYWPLGSGGNAFMSCQACVVDATQSTASPNGDMLTLTLHLFQYPAYGLIEHIDMRVRCHCAGYDQGR